MAVLGILYLKAVYKNVYTKSHTMVAKWSTEIGPNMIRPIR